MMGLVLFFVSISTFNIVSNLLKDNAEIQIQDTTIQVSERLDTLYRQIDMISLQVMTNSYVQQLLLDEVEGRAVSFNQRQSLMEMVNRYQSYSDGIHSFELYLKDLTRISPLNGTSLSTRVDEKWIEEAKAQKGRLVWIGKDPRNTRLYLGIRQVSLMDRGFSNGGYLLTRIDANYFNLKDKSNTDRDADYLVIVDQRNYPVFSNYYRDIDEIVNQDQKVVEINQEDYMVSKNRSDLTGWNTVILTPVDTLMNGLSILRAAILFSGIAGFSIFFFFSFNISKMITKPILKLISTMQVAKIEGLKTISESASTIEILELNKTYNELVENTNHLIGVVYEKELCLSQAELKALQAQINPHFLFNTLEALYWSLEEKEEEELAEVVVAMSDLFRYTISNSKVEDEWVLVKEELEHVERYFHVMKMRFGDRLTWYVSQPADCEVKIPKLLIQPLVENALVHGVGNKIGQGTVSVIVEDIESSSKLLIKVMDDGPGIEEDTLHSIMQSLKSGVVPLVKGKGMAIANVNKRLQLYYQDSEERGLSIESEIGKGTCVTFSIPCKGGFCDVF
ncbi:MAG: sensor histidine kinase [Alkaliphilus sp.]|nr:sensor histidine kinase [Alkaliphilus sp.]